MMLSKADFEDTFPDLFGPGASEGSNRHPAATGPADGPRSSAPPAAAERVAATAVTILDLAPRAKTRIRAANRLPELRPAG